MNQIAINSQVEYAEPMVDEIGLTFKVIEVNGDRVIMEANVNMIIRPTYVAQVSDLKVVA